MNSSKHLHTLLYCCYYCWGAFFSTAAAALFYYTFAQYKFKYIHSKQQNYKTESFVVCSVRLWYCCSDKFWAHIAGACSCLSVCVLLLSIFYVWWDDVCMSSWPMAPTAGTPQQNEIYPAREQMNERQNYCKPKWEKKICFFLAHFKISFFFLEFHAQGIQQ